MPSLNITAIQYYVTPLVRYINCDSCSVYLLITLNDLCIDAERFFTANNEVRKELAKSLRNQQEETLVYIQSSSSSATLSLYIETTTTSQ